MIGTIYYFGLRNSYMSQRNIVYDKITVRINEEILYTIDGKLFPKKWNLLIYRIKEQIVSQVEGYKYVR